VLVGRHRRCYDDAVPMATVRVLLILGAVGGLTAWAVAQGSAVPAADPLSATSVPTEGVREPAGPTGSTTAGEPGFELEIDRLRTGLGVMPSPPASGRNPFRFGAERRARRPASAAPHGVALEGDESTDAGPVAPDRPPMQLLGVAADESDGAPLRTAVIATARQLYLVREGEQIALRFQVLRIGSDVVELRDLATDEPFQLALR
jgi:hypothetical protein